MNGSPRIVIIALIIAGLVITAAAFLSGRQSHALTEAARRDVAHATATAASALQPDSNMTLSDAQQRLANAESDVGHVVTEIQARGGDDRIIRSAIAYLRGLQDLLRSTRSFYRSASAHFDAEEEYLAQYNQYVTPPFDEATEPAEKVLLDRKQLARDQAGRELDAAEAALRTQSTQARAMLRKVREDLPGFNVLPEAVVANLPGSRSG